MIKMLANKVLEFEREGEKAKTKIGFCELPNWVGETPLYKLAVLSADITAFSDNSGNDEEALKLQEKKASLEDEVKSLEEKLEKVKSTGDDKVKAIKEEIAALEAERDSIKEENAKLSNANSNNNKNNRR